MADEFFSMEMPDLQGLIRRLNLFDEQQNKAVIDAMHKIGDNIVQAQRRHIAGVRVGKRLSKYITRSRLYLTDHGYLKISAGYQETAFESDENGFNAGVVGMTYEFGRPGTSRTRNKPTMTQTRNGKKVEVKKGTIQPVPHIRAGYDETLEQNIYLLIDAVNDVIDKLGE